MQFGVHLPLMEWDGTRQDVGALVELARSAEQLGFDAICANDHFVFQRPWLDGPTALAAVTGAAATPLLMTSVALPVVRGPVPLAKTLAALDVVSSGRVVAGVGSGSSPADYHAAGVPFEERWARFDESIEALRALWAPDGHPFVGRYYDTTGVTLEPAPAQEGGPPIWIGSWGSDAGLRSVARSADGWLASAFNITPERFARAWSDLQDHLRGAGRDTGGFPNTLGTMWLHLTDDPTERADVLGRLAGLLHRDTDDLADILPIGPPGHAVEIVGRYAEAGVERIIVWPLTDELHQLEFFAEATESM